MLTICPVDKQSADLQIISNRLKQNQIDIQGGKKIVNNNDLAMLSAENLQEIAE